MLSDKNLDNILDNAISPTIKTGNRLLDCFRKIDDINISSNDCVQSIKLYALNSDKFIFDYEGLKKLIRNNIANYVFNRRAYQQAINDALRPFNFSLDIWATIKQDYFRKDIWL